jgi:hypothetical protein
MNTYPMAIVTANHQCFFSRNYTIIPSNPEIHLFNTCTEPGQCQVTKDLSGKPYAK